MGNYRLGPPSIQICRPEHSPDAQLGQLPVFNSFRSVSGSPSWYSSCKRRGARNNSCDVSRSAYCPRFLPSANAPRDCGARAPYPSATARSRSTRDGRARWKVENENNNTLKTKGYSLTHNFGHGKHYLSALLATFEIPILGLPSYLWRGNRMRYLGGTGFEQNGYAITGL
jgi:hypothetical protein